MLCNFFLKRNSFAYRIPHFMYNNIIVMLLPTTEHIYYYVFNNGYLGFFFVKRGTSKTIHGYIIWSTHAYRTLVLQNIFTCIYIYIYAKCMLFLMKGFSVRNLHTQEITGSLPPSQNDCPGQQQKTLVCYFENEGNLFIYLKIKK